MHTHPPFITKFNVNMLWIWICVSSNSSIQQAAPFASRLALGSHGRFHHGPLHTLQLDISLTSAWQYISYTPKDPKPEIYSNPLKQVWKPGVIIDLHCIVSSCPTFSVYFGFARGYKFRWTLVELRIQSARFTYTTESMGVFSSKPHGETHPMAACDKYATAWSSSLASHALQTPLHMFSGGGSGWWLSWVTCPRIPGKTESH